MAIKRVNVANGTFVLNSADTYVLGDASDGLVGTFAVHFVDDNTFSGSVSVKARSRAISNGASTPAFLAIPYLPLNLNGSAGTYGTGVTTAITTNSIILVPASGLEIALDCTSYTSGSATVYVTPVVGAAA